MHINFQPLLAALEVWDKDGLELCLSLGLEPALESGLLLGAWISCVPPGHRGDTEREPEKKLKCAGGLGKAEHSKPAHIKGS